VAIDGPPKRKSDESTGFSEEDLPQLQDHPAQRRRAGHLHGSAPQAAARLTDGTSNDGNGGSLARPATA